MATTALLAAGAPGSANRSRSDPSPYDQITTNPNLARLPGMTYQPAVITETNQAPPPSTGMQMPTQPFSSFGPDNNLIGTQINPVTGQRTQNTQGMVDQRQAQLNQFQLDPFTGVPTSQYGGYTDWSNARLDEALAAANNMGVDTGKSQGMLDEAADYMRGIQNIPDFGNIDPTDTSAAQALLDQALAQAGQQSIGQYGNLGPADFSAAQGTIDQIKGIVGGLSLPTQGNVGYAQQFGDVARINDAQAQADLNAARGLVGGANLQNFGAIAGPNLGQAQGILNQAVGAANAAPGAINEYGNIRTTDPSAAYAALGEATGLARGANAGSFQGVAGPSTAGAKQNFAQAQSALGSIGLQGFGNVTAEDIAAGTYDQSPEAVRARELGMQGLESIFSGVDRQALAQQALDLFNAQLGDTRQLEIQNIGQKAAALGRLGSGMVTTSLGDLDLQLERMRQQEQNRLAIQVAQQTMGDRNMQLQAALGAGGAWTQEDIANAGMDLNLRNEARDERAFGTNLDMANRQFQAERDLQAQQLKLGQASGYTNLGQADFGVNMGASQFAQSEAARRNQFDLNAANLALSKAGMIGNLGMNNFAVGQGVTQEMMQNRAFQLQQDQAMAQALLGSSGALTSAGGLAGNLAQQEYQARFNERGFQAAQDQAAAQLALAKAGAMQGIGGQSFGMAQAQTGIDLANRDFASQQAMARQATDFANRDFTLAQGQAQANLGLNQAGALQNVAGLEFGMGQQTYDNAMQNQQFQFQQDLSRADLGMQQAGFTMNAAGQQLGMDALGFDQQMANQQLQANLAAQRAGISMDQARGMGNLAGMQQNIDMANAGVAGDQARLLAGLAGQKFDMGAILRGEDRTEADRALNYQMTNLGAQQSILDQMSGLEQQQFGQDMAMQDYMRGERSYQNSLEQQAIQNAAQQAMLEANIGDMNFQQQMQMMNLLANLGFQGAGMFGSESQLADMYNQWATGTIGQVGQNAQNAQFPATPPYNPTAKLPFEPVPTSQLPPPPPALPKGTTRYAGDRNVLA